MAARAFAGRASRDASPLHLTLESGPTVIVQIDPHTTRRGGKTVGITRDRLVERLVAQWERADGPNRSELWIARRPVVSTVLYSLLLTITLVIVGFLRHLNWANVLIVLAGFFVFSFLKAKLSQVALLRYLDLAVNRPGIGGDSELTRE